MENKSEKQKKRRRGKARKVLYRIMAGAFAGIVLLLLIASIVKPDKKFSDEENRVLAQFPALSTESIGDKSYMTDLEAYAADQFIGRDKWISLKVQCELLLGKREFNGVYLGKKHYLMQIPSEPDWEHVDANLEAMNQFADRNGSVLVNAMIIPNAAYIMKSYLPKGAPVRDQGQDMKYIKKQLAESVGCIDLTKILQSHVDEGLYYKTDHHWTSKAAAYAVEAASGPLKIDSAQAEYQVYTVTTKFSGTLASKSGYHKTKDSIEVYSPKDVKLQYLVSDSDDPEKRATVYDRSALEEKDQYQLFFGGNHARVDIVTANKTTRKLLIFKDSYANCFVPFLLPYYNEIIMIDPRYYYENVQTLIDNKRITDVLFLYNMDTFMTDNSIADVLASESE